jgi:hypothetical protein
MVVICDAVKTVLLAFSLSLSLTVDASDLKKTDYFELIFAENKLVVC